jgi:hypothetical protein
MAAVDARPIVVRLEFHLEDDSPTGRASDGAGSAREFVGCTGLVAAIDSLVRGNSQATEADASGAGEGGAMRFGQPTDDSEQMAAASRTLGPRGDTTMLYTSHWRSG